MRWSLVMLALSLFLSTACETASIEAPIEGKVKVSKKKKKTPSEAEKADDAASSLEEEEEGESGEVEAGAEISELRDQL